MIMGLREYMLPGGYVTDEGRVMRDVVLLPLNGFCERMIAERGDLTLPALATHLLTGCIGRIGEIEDVTQAVVRELLVGDRQYLLLKLREMTFGPVIRAVIRCSWPDCGEKMDIDFSADIIPVKNAPQTGRLHTVQLSEAAGGMGVTFRLPNGNDQEALSQLVEKNEAAAADLLLVRCIRAVEPAHLPLPETVASFTLQAKQEIEEAMMQLAPQLDLTLEAVCPECRRSFVASFDLERFIADELRTGLDLLLQEVHYLALHYHWSEGEILGMSRENRRRYIGVLSTHMERMHDTL